MNYIEAQNKKKTLSALNRFHLLLSKSGAGLINNRGVSRGGEKMDVQDRGLDEVSMALIEARLKELDSLKRRLRKDMEDILQEFPIWEWLSDQKGVGIVVASWLVTEIDINEAATPGKVHRFSGMAPGKMKGLKRCRKNEYTPDMGELVKEVPGTKNKPAGVIYRTETLIPTDRMSKGFLCPYNKMLKTALCGWTAQSMVRSKSSYYTDYYLPYKNRLENSARLCWEYRKNDGWVQVEWRNARKDHRKDAAMRYMAKQFVNRFIPKWRELEGLPVTQPYHIAKLGMEHHKSAPEFIPPEIDRNWYEGDRIPSFQEL